MNSYQQPMSPLILKEEAVYSKISLKIGNSPGQLFALSPTQWHFYCQFWSNKHGTHRDDHYKALKKHQTGKLPIL